MCKLKDINNHKANILTNGSFMSFHFQNVVLLRNARLFSKFGSFKKCAFIFKIWFFFEMQFYFQNLKGFASVVFPLSKKHK